MLAGCAGAAAAPPARPAGTAGMALRAVRAPVPAHELRAAQCATGIPARGHFPGNAGFQARLHLAEALVPRAAQGATGIMPVGISNANHGRGCPCHTAKPPRCHGPPAQYCCFRDCPGFSIGSPWPGRKTRIPGSSRPAGTRPPPHPTLPLGRGRGNPGRGRWPGFLPPPALRGEGRGEGPRDPARSARRARLRQEKASQRTSPPHPGSRQVPALKQQGTSRNSLITRNTRENDCRNILMKCD